MATVDSDDDLISLARRKTGAQRVSQHPRSALQSDLDEVKEQVARQVEAALNKGTINIYEGDVAYKMAKHLFLLRVADRRRAKGNADPASGGVVPAEEIPKGIGRLQRHTFQNATLGHWRDEVVRGYNRITED